MSQKFLNGVSVEGADLDITSGKIQLNSTSPQILFTESDVTANWRTRVSGGSYRIQYASNGTTFTDYLVIGASQTTFDQNVTFEGSVTTDSILAASNFALDVGGNITLDADSGSILLKDGGTQYLTFTKSGNNAHIVANREDGDIKFFGNDGGSSVTALTLDMSEGGNATFAGDVKGVTFNSIENAASGGFPGSKDYLLAGTGDRGGGLIINDISGARYAITAGGYDLTFSKETDDGSGTVSHDIWMRANATDGAGNVNTIDFFKETNFSSNATFTGDVTMTQSSGNNILYLNSSGGGNPVIYLQDSTVKWGQFVSSGNLHFRNETTGVDTLKLSGSNAFFAGNVTTNGDIIIDNSSGDPFLKLKTAAQEYVIRIDQSDSEKFQIRDTTNGATRLTITTAGDANFGGNISSNGTISATNFSGSSSGTNTGDQVLPTDFVSAANGGTFGGDLTIEHASTPSLKLKDTTDPDLEVRIRAANSYGYFEVDNTNTSASSRLQMKIDGVNTATFMPNQFLTNTEIRIFDEDTPAVIDFKRKNTASGILEGQDIGRIDFLVQDTVGSTSEASVARITVEAAETHSSTNKKSRYNFNVNTGTSLESALTIGSDKSLTVKGDLIVSGTTTTLNTQTVEVEDNILQLNTTQGSPDTATAATSGISVYRGDGVTQASLIFDDADDRWDLTNHLRIGGDLTVDGHVQTNRLYNTGDLTVLNKAGSAWLTFAYKNTSASEVVYDLANVGTLSTSGSATFGGQVIFPSAATTKPVLPNGFISRNDNTDTSGRHDIWGISERYYPSNSTSSDAWGIQWSGTPNDIVFVGAGTDVVTISLDEGNATFAGTVSASNLSGTNTGDQVLPTDFYSVADANAQFFSALRINADRNIVSGTDLDTDLESGGTFSSYGTANTSWNAPQSYGGVVATAFTAGIRGQHFYDVRHGQSDFSDFWFRSKNNLGYSPWSKVWTNLNDGSGSGLDADTLDGNHASAFALSSVVNQTDFVSKASGGTFGGNITVQDIIMGSADRFRHGSYLELSYGASNTSQFTFNADYDGSQTGTYTPHYSGVSSAGMSIVKMPSGGIGGLNFYVKNHGTTSGSHNISTFTKILELNQNGISTFGGNVSVGGNSLTAGSLDINGTADFTGKVDFQGDAAIEGGSGYGVFKGYSLNDNHFISVRGVVANSSTLSITGGHQTTFVEHADAVDEGWYFKSFTTGTYREIARIDGTNQMYLGGNKVWNAGNDGSGSGLDADTVDGVQGNQFLQTTTSSSTAGPGNANTNISIGDSGTNHAYVQSHGSKPLKLNPSGNAVHVGNNRILTVADEGSGNGLDADTLDGNHASAFALSSVVNQTDFVSKASGGTFTGDLNVHTNSTTGALSVGRGSDQAIKLHVNDTVNTIFAYQDSDGDGDHQFILRRDFQGTGASDFKIQNGSTSQLLINKDGQVTIPGNAIISGNLTVNGTTTTLNTATVEVEDNIIVLNKTASDGSATASTSGIAINRSGTTSDASFIFDDADDFWDLTHNLKVAGDIDTSGDIHIDDGSTSAFQTTNKLRFGHTSWNNNIGIESYWMRFGCNQNEGFKFQDSTSNMLLQLNGGNNTSGNGAFSATFKGSIIPAADASLTLGTGSLRWNFAYINNTLTVTDGNFNTTTSFKFNKGLVVEGSVDSGGTDMGYYQSAGTNIVLKGDSAGRSGIFFESEKDGTNINDPSDYGFIQFHSYGYDNTSGEANNLVIGVANDSTDKVILQAPYNGGVMVGYNDATSGTGLTLSEVIHSNSSSYNAGNWDTAYTHSQATHAPAFSGTWNGADMPGSRFGGYQANGGEVVFQQDNPGTGRMSVMTDGNFHAGELGGFYSLYSSSSYNSKAGFNTDSNGTLQFVSDGTSALADFDGRVIAGNGSQAANNDAMLTLNATQFSGLDIKSARTEGNIGGLRYYDTASDTVPQSQFLVEVDGSYNFYNGTNGAQLRLKIEAAGTADFTGTVKAPYITASNPSGASDGSAQEVARFVNVSTGATSSYMYIGASSGTDWRLGKNINGTAGNTNFAITKHSGTTLFFEIDGVGNTTTYGSAKAAEIKTDNYQDGGGNALFLAGNITTGASRSLNLRTTGSSSDPSTSDDSNSTGITWGQRSDSNPYYMIYPNLENWSSSGNYSKLTLSWHTGIKIGADKQYGGTRFYNQSPDITNAAVIMNVGVGNDNVSVVNNLIVGGSLNVGPGPSRFTDQQNAGSRLELYNNRQDAGNVEVYRIAAYNSVEVAGVHFYRGGGGDSGYTKIFSKKNNSSSLQQVVQFGQDNSLTSTFSGNVTIGTGNLSLSGNGTITTGGYWQIMSAASGNGYLDAGGTIFIRDKDDNNADRITIDTATGYVGMGIANTSNQRLTLAEADSNGSHIKMNNSRSGGGYWVVGVGDTNSNSSITDPGGIFFYNGSTKLKLAANGDATFAGNIKLSGGKTITHDNQTLYNGSSTSTQYLKILDRGLTTGSTENYMHFQLRSYNSSEFSAEVRIHIPTYAGFVTSYGTMDAGMGVQIEIKTGGLSTQSQVLDSIIECANLTSTGDNIELYLKITPPSNITVVTLKNYADADVLVDTTQSWTTTAPSNQKRDFLFTCGATRINSTVIGRPNLEVEGNILLTGPVTTTNQGRMIDFTGFDKEGITDFSDRAFISHTTNIGGHAGSVLQISSQNDVDDGIAFTTHASSLLKHNGDALFSEGHLPTWSEIQSKPSNFDPTSHQHNANEITSGVLDAARLPVNLQNVASSSDNSGIYFRSSNEGISGEGWCTGHYAYNHNDGFLFLNRTPQSVAVPVFHIGGYNNAGYGGYATEDSLITLTRSDGTKTTGSGYAHKGLSSSTYYTNIIKTTTKTVFNDAQGYHEFTGNASTPTGSFSVGSASDTNQRSLHLHAYVANKSSTLKCTDGNLHIDSADGNALYLNFYAGASTNINFGNANSGVCGTLSSSGLLRVGNDVVAYYSFSDKRLKKDIKTTENNLDKILSLRPVEYKWKEGPREGVKEIGLIAQEVEKVVPEVVRVQSRHDDENYDEGVDYKQVDYEHLVSTLIGAMQEQQDQINDLKKEIQTLKSK